MIEAFMNWLGRLLGWYDTPMPSTDNIASTPELPYIPASVPPVMAPTDPKTVTDTTLPITPVQEAPSTPQKPTLADFLKWQWQFEGANPANNNPGNYRIFYGGYLPMYEPVKVSKGGFAIFPTLALGELYATNSTKNVIKNHPELTILTYIKGDGDWSGYAPASDKNPVTSYASFLAKGLGVGTDFLMRNLA
ncbi:MAG: hypothetical protein ACYC3F_17235 [Gemmatimonadaceae bacterium]